MSDERLKRNGDRSHESSTGADERLGRGNPNGGLQPTANPDDTRGSRAAADRAITEDRVLTDDERLAMFQQQFFREALPDLPEITGYHVCWLTTTDPRDTIHHRMRLGYEPVKPEDVPAWKHTVVKSGEYEGMIGVNEMLAFKIPLPLWQRYMREVHHDAPAREQEKLTTSVDLLKDQAAGVKGRIDEEEGTAALRRSRPAPRFDREEGVA
jgi:hypothetical protein